MKLESIDHELPEASDRVVIHWQIDDGLVHMTLGGDECATFLDGQIEGLVLERGLEDRSETELCGASIAGLTFMVFGQDDSTAPELDVCLEIDSVEFSEMDGVATIRGRLVSWIEDNPFHADNR